MRVKYIGVSFGVDGLTNGKEYDVLMYEEENGMLRVVDDSDEDYLYHPVNPRPIADPRHPGGRFEIIEDDSIGTLERVINGKG